MFDEMLYITQNDSAFEYLYLHIHIFCCQKYIELFEIHIKTRK